MRTAAVLLALVAPGLAGPSPAPGQETTLPGPSAISAKATAFVARMVKGDFDQAVKDFDATMRKVVPPDKLKEIWQGLTGRAGAFQKQKGVRTERGAKYDFAFVTCLFKDATLDVKVVFDKDGKITGMFFVPPKSPHKYQAPAYVRAKAFREVEVKFGAKGWELPGTLSLPAGDGPFPAVVLVHGSGPHDRDETIGANRPFRDLAGGLASRGIAVLRYEKRTKEHAAKMLSPEQSPTVREEVTDDALAAVALLRQTKGIDPKRVFVLGHSLGAILLPYLGSRDRDIAGLIALAGTCRPLEDLIGEQLGYIFSLKGPPSDKQKAELEKLRKEAARVKDPKLSRDTPSSELPLGVPAAYWLSLRETAPGKFAGRFKQPLLILWGERDYQVTRKDYESWRKTLAGRKGVQFQSYPRLNHLFMAGAGKARPEEYDQPGHVEEAVIADIADWVKKR